MRRLLLIAALLIGGPVIACAQPVGATLTGTVRDAETGAPLPGVNVFLAETTLGTATDARGRFVIEHVPLGQHRLYASMVGYEAAARDTVLRRTRRPYVVHVRLTPDVLALEGVTVEAERDRRWQRRLRRFERHFLGASANADSTRLLNPEVLRFDATWWGKLEVSAAAPLVVENRALGYRIRYFLEEFETTGTRTQWDGEPLFEPLVPEDSAQAARWRARREHAYRGSLRHFLRALRAGHVREAGFTMRLHRRDPFGRRGGGYDRRGRGGRGARRRLRPTRPPRRCAAARRGTHRYVVYTPLPEAPRGDLPR